MLQIMNKDILKNKNTLSTIEKR